MRQNINVQTDLRDFLARVDAAGELKRVSGAHWDKEIGAVTEVLYREKVDKSPLLLFDDVPGYKPGLRCLYGMLGSPLRLALGLLIDDGISTQCFKTTFSTFIKKNTENYKAKGP